MLTPDIQRKLADEQRKLTDEQRKLADARRLEGILARAKDSAENIIVSETKEKEVVIETYKRSVRPAPPPPAPAPLPGSAAPPPAVPAPVPAK